MKTKGMELILTTLHMYYGSRIKLHDLEKKLSGSGGKRLRWSGEKCEKKSHFYGIFHKIPEYSTKFPEYSAISGFRTEKP